MDEPIKPVDNRNPNGTFGPNNNANPLGRPKGQTLKEWMRDKLLNMDETQREEFIKDVPREMRWKMAEGNPHNTEDITSGGKEIQPLLVKFLDGKEPSNDSDTK